MSGIELYLALMGIGTLLLSCYAWITQSKFTNELLKLIEQISATQRTMLDAGQKRQKNDAMRDSILKLQADQLEELNRRISKAEVLIERRRGERN